MAMLTHLVTGNEASDTREHQVQEIDLFCVTTDKVIEGLQAQPGTNLAKIRSHGMVGTVPEEVKQGSWEFKSLLGI